MPQVRRACGLGEQAGGSLSSLRRARRQGSSHHAPGRVAEPSSARSVVALLGDRLGVESSYRFTLVGEADESTRGRTRMWRVRHSVNRYINPITRPLARRLPGFAILTHTGRKTGREYQTPINVFKRDDHYLFFLTYGSDVQWVKNVLATGTASIETRGRVVELEEPELITDPKLRAAPPHVRFVEGRIAGATQYMRMRISSST